MRPFKSSALDRPFAGAAARFLGGAWVVGVTLFVTVAAAVADEPLAAPAAPVETVEPGASAAAVEDVAAPARTPLAREVETARTEFSARLKELNGRYAAVTDAAERSDLARQVAALKLGLETRLVEIQLHHARERGLTDLVAELEAALAVAHARADADADSVTPAAPAAAAR